MREELVSEYAERFLAVLERIAAALEKDRVSLAPNSVIPITPSTAWAKQPAPMKEYPEPTGEHD